MGIKMKFQFFSLASKSFCYVSFLLSVPTLFLSHDGILTLSWVFCLLSCPTAIFAFGNSASPTSRSIPIFQHSDWRTRMLLPLYEPIEWMKKWILEKAFYPSVCNHVMQHYLLKDSFFQFSFLSHCLLPVFICVQPSYNHDYLCIQLSLSRPPHQTVSL